MQTLSLAVGAALVFLAGCATPKVQTLPADAVLRSDLLSFLQDGATRREDVLLRLGTPSAQFEEQRILTYQIRLNQEGKAELFWPRRSEINPVLTHWDPGIFSLVLVFDDRGVLQRHSLVGAR